ncbi:MaoC family dehydratase N-terminal domain-containing protein [Rhodococcus sp. IEGM 1401]|jgi:acyl dehydratase|uniref:MaoC family dehydratase N-terminal domain-containing protein n=1 Tax=unclassified Rhodococcus (in: high G+C Gram-positive bacteria) TaxID=192944 RepID=UPI001FB4479C|nr:MULTISPECIES: MaoC family dehydratase N-terminal domain-containing protein [unclassified Rhodococcus (in: high G+C Gram-positive bacteria)]MCJ0894766.1 MaoC family dehydratase N-terminal domain-containing protein [Rhodococcus sp. ARC_M5]MCJ0980724.1 MaoC family dehydratase N-terminal domain-containing protein [Rhodococcus sp. ARC_M12]MCZ4563799.1 MaoC family dehydratase N-terminal domain-containing protein [Rhodococcus sp. IEGM 1401]MDI9923944.1 MaoC family dehydratase N-terminal domain-cont
MSIDPAAIGTELEPVAITVDAARLRFFAKAIGETNPVYIDTDAAQAAGHPDLPVPPTFLFSIELDSPDPFAWMSDLGVDLRFVLHGEQIFTYHSTAHAGDTLTARSTITDIYSKKGGALDFVVKDTAVTRADGSAVADLRAVLVVRNPGGGQ